jgi:hypothetical protein
MPAFQRDDNGKIPLDAQGLPALPVTQIVGNPWPDFTASLRLQSLTLGYELPQKLIPAAPARACT